MAVDEQFGSIGKDRLIIFSGGENKVANLIDVPWDKFDKNINPRDAVSANFKIYELTKSDTADRRGIDNSLKSVKQIQAAVYLSRNILQPVRDEFGRFSPNSIFRSQELERSLKNKRLPWKSKSQHTKGNACDIEVPGLTTMELAKWITENLEFDQVICECYNASKGPNSGWVHASIVPPGAGQNRKNVLSYVMDKKSKKYIYVNGLKESP